LHALSKPIFHRNDFVLISTTYPDMPEILARHGAWCWSSPKITRFRKFRLWVHIKTGPIQVKEKLPTGQDKTLVQSFLMLKSSLPDFVYILRIADKMMECHFDLRFVVNKDIDSPLLGRTAQEELLIPFTKLRGHLQKCKINGADLELAENVTTLLTPNVHWARYQKWEMWDLLMHKKSIADTLLRSGFYWPAQLAYLSCFELIDAPVGHQVLLDVNAGDDDNLRKSFARWRAIVTVNVAIALAYVALQANTADPYRLILQEEDRIRVVAQLTTQESAVWYSLLGVAYLGSKDYSRSIRHFRLASVTWPVIEACRDCLQLVRSLDTSTTNTSEYWDERLLMLEILTILDYTPWDCELVSPQSALAFVDTERAVLKSIGYNGPMLQEKLLQIQDHPVKVVSIQDEEGGEEVINSTTDIARRMENFMKAGEQQTGEKLHVSFGMDAQALQHNGDVLKCLDESEISTELAERGMHMTTFGFFALNA